MLSFKQFLEQQTLEDLPIELFFRHNVGLGTMPEPEKAVKGALAWFRGEADVTSLEPGVYERLIAFVDDIAPAPVNVRIGLTMPQIEKNIKRWLKIEMRRLDVI